MKFSFFIPLLTFIIPAVIISTLLFMLDTPPPPIQLVGFVVLLIGCCVTYYMGVSRVFKEMNKTDTLQ